MVVSLSRQTKPLAGKNPAASAKLSRPQDSALTAPKAGNRKPTSTLSPVSRRAKIYITVHQAFSRILTARATATLMESKLSDPQGQYFFWEPVNNDIPETELSQHKKITGCPSKKTAPHDQ
jgi:hypothetical protein